MSDMFIVHMLLVKDCQTLLMDPTANKPTAAILVTINSASYHDDVM